MASNAHSSPPAAPSAEALLEPGSVLDRYRVEGKLREGGMAIVYVGEHVNTGARVAIKVLRSEYADQPEFIARFDREAQVMGRLYDSPHIAQVHDVGNLEDGRRYLAMEFVRGADLDDLLVEARGRDEQIDLMRACRLLRDIARGLEAAHRHDIVHRDLKPSNIMVEQRRGSEERAKLLDFGVSADLGDKGVAQGLTATGTVIGTPEYMAPEQAAGIAASPSFDIYALGVVMFEALAGQPPPAKGWRAGTLPGVATLRPGIPEDLNALVRECLHMDSTKRIQSASEIAGRLDALIHELEGPAAQLHKWADARPSAAAGSVRSVPGPMTPPHQPPVVVDTGAVTQARPAAPPAPVAPPPPFAQPPVAVPTPIAPAPSPVPPAGQAPAPAFVPTPSVHASPAPVPPPRKSRGLAPALITLALVGVGLAALWFFINRDGAEPVAKATDPTEAQKLGAVTPVAVEPEPEPEAAPEPEPAPEPEILEPEPKPKPKPKPVPKAKPKPKPVPKAKPKPTPEPTATTPDPEPAKPANPVSSPECETARSKAAKARKTWGNWKNVLAATRDTRCWTGRYAEDRRVLRVEALMELKRYDACVDAAGSSSNPKVKKWAAHCRKQTGK